MTHKLHIRALLLLLALSQVGWGATYYVDADAADGGTGTTTATSGANCAWNTWSDVWDGVIAPGDVILFQRGDTWTANYAWPESGVSGNLITFGAYGTGSNPILAGKLTISSRSYWVVDGIDVRNPATGTGIIGIAISNASYGTVRNCDVSAEDTAVSVSNTCDNITIASVAVEGTTSAAAITVSGTPTNTTIRDVESESPNGWMFTNMASFTLDSCTVTTNEVQPSLYFNGCTAGQVTDCRLNAMVQFINACANITVTSSVVDGADVDGFSTHNTTHDITYLRCVAKNCGIITDLGSGDGFTAHDSNYNINIVDCLAYGNLNTAIAVIGTTSGQILNCVGWNNGGDYTGSGGVTMTRAGVFIDTTGNNVVSGIGWKIRNSVFGSNYPREMYLSTSAAAGVDLNYNQYYHIGDGITESSFATINGGSSNIDWATYHATYEANSQYANPLFLSPSTGDFRLQKGSPCINTGTNLGASYDDDFLGYDQDLYGSTWEIGAYVYRPKFIIKR